LKITGYFFVSELDQVPLTGIPDTFPEILPDSFNVVPLSVPVPVKVMVPGGLVEVSVKGI
jgi:hypothetical protein